jgi:hypothetical protein
MVRTGGKGTTGGSSGGAGCCWSPSPVGGVGGAADASSDVMVEWYGNIGGDA